MHALSSASCLKRPLGKPLHYARSVAAERLAAELFLGRGSTATLEIVQ